MVQGVKITRYINQISVKNPAEFRPAPCAKTYTWGCTRGVPLVAGFEGVQPLAFIAALWIKANVQAWLHPSCVLCVSMQCKSQCPGMAAPQLCTLCEHAVLANLVNPIKMGGSARWRRQCPWVGMVSHNQLERQFTGWSWPWPSTFVGLVAAGEILEHR